MSLFDLHAFISYAHLHNEPLEPGQKGWVTRFHATLQMSLCYWPNDKCPQGTGDRGVGIPHMIR